MSALAPGVAPDPAVAADDDDRQVDAGQEIHEVAVELVELLVAHLQLVVDRGELLVG